MTVGAKAYEIVEGVHNRDRRIGRERRQRALVTNLDVLVVPAVLATVAARCVKNATCIRPQPIQTRSGAGVIHEGFDGSGAINGACGTVNPAILSPLCNRGGTDHTAAGRSAFAGLVVNTDGTGSRAEHWILGLPSAGLTCSYGNPEQEGTRS